MRKIIQLVVVISMLFIFFSCNLSNNKGTEITIFISNGGRLIHGDFVNLNVSSYVLSASESQGGTIDPINLESGSATIKNIKPGIWTFTVGGYNSDNLLLFQGSETYTVSYGDNLDKTIPLEPAGSADIIFNFDWSSIDNPVLSVKATKLSDSTVLDIVPVISGNAATVKQNIPSGVYSLDISLSSDLSGSKTSGIQSEVIGTYSDTLVVLNQSYSVNISIPVNSNLPTMPGTTFRMSSGTYGVDYALTIYNGKYDFDEIRQTEIFYKEKGQAATYSTVIISGVKKLNLITETSSVIDKGTFSFTFAGEKSGTYTFVPSGSGVSFSGNFVMYDKEYLPGEFYLMENNASIIDFNTSNRYVTEYFNNSQKIYPVPNYSYEAQPGSSLFAYTTDQVVMSQMYPESETAPYYTGIEIVNTNNSALNLKYYFLSKYKGIVEYSYIGGPSTATPDIAPFNFDVVKETTTNGGNGNNFYRWNFTEVYNLDGVSNDLYTNDFACVNSINNKAVNIKFEGSTTDRRIHIYDPSNTSSFKAMWADVIGANSFGEIVIAVKYSIDCDPILGITSVFDNGEIAYFAYNHSKKEMKLYKGNNVLTGNSFILKLTDINDVAAYNLFQPTNKFVVLQSMKLDLAQEFGPYNDSRLAFGPGSVGYYFAFAQDAGTNPLPVNNSTDYAGVIKSFNLTSSSTADLEYYISNTVVKPGTYNLKFLDVNSGVFERLDNSGVLLNSGMFITSPIVGSKITQTPIISGIFDTSNAIKFMDGTDDIRLEIYPGGGEFVIRNETSPTSFSNINYNMFGIGSNIAVVNIDSSEVTASPYQKDWYIIDSSTYKLYMTNDIFYYLNSGDLSNTGKVLTFTFSHVAPQGM